MIPMGCTRLTLTLLCLVACLIFGRIYGDETINYGTITDAEGTYIGQLEDGHYQGHGTYTWNSGTKYSGEFVNGQPEGHGVIELSDGSVYVGKISNMQVNGEGILKKPDGSRFEGYFVNSLLNGQGRYFNSEGAEVYKGEFKNGNRHGVGVHTEVNEVYEGEFVDNDRHGYGVVVYANGDRFEGQFDHGVRDSGVLLIKEQEDKQIKQLY